MIDIFDLGLRIRNVRKAHNLTQEQLAEKIKVSPHYVYELEHGYKSMSIYTLANIATVLDAPLDFLVFGKEPATTPENKDYITHDDLDRLVESIPLYKRDSAYSALKNLLALSEINDNPIYIKHQESHMDFSPCGFLMFIVFLFHNNIHNTSRNIDLLDNVTCELVGDHFLSLCDNLILWILLADRKCCLSLTVDLYSDLYC